MEILNNTILSEVVLINLLFIALIMLAIFQVTTDKAKSKSKNAIDEDTIDHTINDNHIADDHIDGHTFDSYDYEEWEKGVDIRYARFEAKKTNQSFRVFEFYCKKILGIEKDLEFMFPIEEIKVEFQKNIIITYPTSFDFSKFDFRDVCIAFQSELKSIDKNSVSEFHIYYYNFKHSNELISDINFSYSSLVTNAKEHYLALKYLQIKLYMERENLLSTFAFMYQKEVKKSTDSMYPARDLAFAKEHSVRKFAKKLENELSRKPITKTKLAKI